MRLRYAFLVALTALVLPGAVASATMADYVFASSTGSSISADWWTDIWTGYYGSRWSHAGQTADVSLPFTFKFNNVAYTDISLSSHGLIKFGSGVSGSPSNNLTGTNGPAITAFWDGLYVPGYAPNPGCYFNPVIRYGTTGSEPNRIFIIDYVKVSREYSDNSGYGPMFMDFQVRLYEGSNRIEFYYANASATWPSCLSNWWGTGSTQTSGTIGLMASSTDYLSVTPDGSSPTISRSTVNNSVDLRNSIINSNTVYSFTPCFMIYTGNTAQGGTTTMASGDVLLSNVSIERGDTRTLQPFTIFYDASSVCGTRNLTYTVTGPAAADYTITPSGLSPLATGNTVTFNVTFTPQSIGLRTATLTVNDPVSGPRVYTLRATGLPRVSWTPDLAQGATSSLTSGDTLLRNIVVRRGTPRDFTPITFRNFSSNGSIPPAIITATIDSAGGISTQYQIVGPATANLGPGQTYTPVIRFLGTGLGEQHATLTINADGEIRSFPLKAISGAPGIVITAGGVAVTAENALYHETYSCVGEQTTVVPLVVTNPGQLPMTVSSVELYLTDSTIQQGTPSFPLVRDARGRAVRAGDYVISEVPGSVPLNGTPMVAVPFSIDPGQSRTLYATFAGTLPGKRFGRAFVRTNAENVTGTDTTLNGVPNSVVGLLTFDLVGRAVGSQLAANGAGLSLKTVVFPHTRVGDTTVASFTVANTGACNLRINREKLRIFSGDVNEFRMLTSLRRASLDAATGDYLLAPGMVDTITVRFIPSRNGTRLATIFLQTNDSTISRPGISERGGYYLDLTGRGLAGLDAADLVLDPVVIGSSVSGVAVIENTQTTTIGISSIGFLGDDAAEFSEDAAMPWPAMPATVLPGQKLSLGVRLTPVGAPGMRRTTMIVVTANGDTVRLGVRGEAGTQTLTLAPTTLFENLTIAVGQSRRQTLMISNSGTLPVRIASLQLRGADSASYRLGALPRRDLEAGQTEYLEVTFAPTAPGQTSAEIVVTTSDGQPYTAMLGGTALKVKGRDPADPTTAAPGGIGTPERRDGTSKSSGRPTIR